MNKIFKKISVAALCIVMLMLSIVPAFAKEIILIEDHSVVDCTHYYKENGNYYFQIKCPKGELDKVTVGLSGSRGGAATVAFKYTSFTGIFGKEHAYSDDNYDYTWLIIKCSDYPDSYESNWGGMIAKIYYFNGENSKMATNTSNYSTTPGNGYYLSE